MDSKIKKKYQRPTITKIDLDAKTAVLAVCKIDGKFGPGKSGCKNIMENPCNQIGS
ncbi:MAG: hypothetical protein PVG87_23700 [Desulfobacteraceae bacterium]|jgi:hypothetical protein